MAQRGRKPQDPALKQAIIKSRFNQVKELMELGYPKYIACKKLKIPRNWIYNNFTKKQMVILDQIYFGFSTGNSARAVIGNGC